MGEPCRNQGAAFAEKPCGYTHEGPCDPSSFVVLRRFDVEALLEEWGDLDEDPFWKPLGASVRVVAADWSEGIALARLSSTTTEVERLRGALTLPDGRYEQVCEVGHHTVAGDLLDECPWPLEGWQGEPCRADMESVIVWHHKLLAALSPSTNDTEGGEHG